MSKIGAFLSLLMAMTQSAPFIPAANCTAPEIPIVTISLGFTVLPLSPICCLASNHPFSINGLVPRAINSLETQKPQGFIIMNIPTDAIADICGAAAYGSQAMIGLMDQDGNLIAGTSAEHKGNRCKP